YCYIFVILKILSTLLYPHYPICTATSLSRSILDISGFTCSSPDFKKKHNTFSVSFWIKVLHICTPSSHCIHLLCRFLASGISSYFEFLCFLLRKPLTVSAII